MPLKNLKTDETLASVIEKVLKSDYKKLQKSKEFSFDWSVVSEHEVYKIYAVNKNKEVLGVMALVDRPDEYRIHMELIEIMKSNQGKNKTIDHIAGCLIAFACQLAFDRGYFGFLSLQPKTKLIDLYQEKYGFRQYGRLLAVEGEAANYLIQKYLEDEK
ncbi:MAG: hypothetical protein AB8G22_08830 [Saprospiraceae bacterium]